MLANQGTKDDRVNAWWVLDNNVGMREEMKTLKFSSASWESRNDVVVKTARATRSAPTSYVRVPPRGATHGTNFPSVHISHLTSPHLILPYLNGPRSI